MTKERVLRFEGVKMGYAAPEGGRVEVLDVPAFELPGGGGHVALRGSSVAGKTTLLYVIAGIVKPDAGVVSVAGADVVKLSEAARDRWCAKHVGYIYRSFRLL